MVVVATILFACVPPAQSLTPARFEIVELWITPNGYDAGSVKVTKVFTDQQYWFGATIRKYGEESAQAVYTWTLDKMGSVEDHDNVQSGEVLEYARAVQFSGYVNTFGYQIVLLLPGATHTFSFTIGWNSASGTTDTVSSSVDFAVEKPAVTTTASEVTFTGVSTAFSGWTTAETIVNESVLTNTEVILVVAVLVLGAVVVILLIRRGDKKKGKS